MTGGVVKSIRALVAVAFAILWTGPAMADSLTAYLRQKADDFRDFYDTWHAPGPGGSVAEVEFADETYQDAVCLRGRADSTFWTGVDLGTLAIEYGVTGSETTRQRIIAIADYLHNVKAVTETPGYIARYLAPDEAPFNCTVEIESENWIRPSEGPWTGWYWVSDTSRDMYVAWFWGLTRAYDALAESNAAESVRVRDQITEDQRDVILTLADRNWWIHDENGHIDGNGAAWVEPFRRLSWLIQAWHVTGDEDILALLNERQDRIIDHLPADLWGLPNKYMDYFAFNLIYFDMDSVFRLWEDPTERAEIFDVWMRETRRLTRNTHNAWFDAMYLDNCALLDRCGEDTRAVADDIVHGLDVFWPAPNFKKKVIPPELPLDPFSVWASDLLSLIPFLHDLVDIEPQTADAHQVENRCWTDFLWQRSPYHVDCGDAGTNVLKTAPGLDYLLPYWTAVHAGALPPDDDADDDTTDDDTDDTPGDDDTDEPTDDDSASGDDEDDNSGCGC